MKKKLLVVCVSLVAGLLVCEALARYFFYRRILEKPLILSITTFLTKPNASGKWYHFDVDHNLRFSGSVRYNNQGFRSAYDWQEEKGEDEFRIAVFGDSITECVTNDFGLVDVAHEILAVDGELAKRLGGKKVFVANFACSGSGFVGYADVYTSIREGYKPDLSVIAFTEAAFDFRVRVAHIPPFPLPRDGGDGYSIEIPGFGGELKCLPLDAAPMQILHYSGSDETVILNKQRMDDARRSILSHAGKRSILFSKKLQLPKLIKSWWSKLRAPKPADVQTPRAVAAYSPSEQDLEVFRSSVAKFGPEPLVLVNLPNANELINPSSEDGPVSPYTYWPYALKRWPDLKILPLEEFLPRDASYKERYDWFNLPTDAHLSNAGAKAYGEGMAKALSRYLKGEEPALATQETADREIARAGAFFTGQ